MALADSSSQGASQPVAPQPEAAQAQQEQQEEQTVSEKELLQRLVELTEGQAASLQRIVQEVGQWKEAYETML